MFKTIYSLILNLQIMTIDLNRVRIFTGWVMTGLITAMLLISAMDKFTMPKMAENFTRWGLDDWIAIVAIGEIVSILLFLIPKTRIIGILLLSSHMGGAIVVHMSHGESFIIQSVILVFIWVTGFIRNPELLAKFKN